MRYVPKGQLGHTSPCRNLARSLPPWEGLGLPGKMVWTRKLGVLVPTQIYRCRHTHDRAQEITVCLAQWRHLSRLFNFLFSVIHMDVLMAAFHKWGSRGSINPQRMWQMDTEMEVLWWGPGDTSVWIEYWTPASQRSWKLSEPIARKGQPS